jgi:fucose permease
MITGPLWVAGALVTLCLARDFRLLLAAAAMLGLGGGLLNLSTNTLTAGFSHEKREKNAELNRLGIFFGLGALLVPLGLGALLERHGLAAVLLPAAALCAVVGLACASLRYPSPALHSVEPAAHPLALLRDPWIAAAAFLLFLQAGNEMVLSGYATTHLTLFAGMTAASWATVGMWVAVVVARALLASLARRVSGHAIVVGSALGTMLGSLGLVFASSFAAAALALAVTGASMAGIFPTMMGIAGARFPNRSGAAFGAVLAVARTGAMLMPWMVGSLAGRQGTHAAMAAAAGSAGGILVLALVIHRIDPSGSAAGHGNGY